jgi:hypothetical protein
MPSSRSPHLRRAAPTLVVGALLLALAGASAASDRRPATPVRASAPHIALTGHPRVRTRGASTTIAFRVTGPRVAVRCRLDTRPFHACQSPARLRGLKPGSHRLQLRATNRFGDSRVTVSWVVARTTDRPVVFPLPIAAPLFPVETTPVLSPPVVTPDFTPPVPASPVLPSPPLTFAPLVPPAPRPPSSGDTGGGLAVSLGAPAAGAVLSGFATLTASAATATGRVAWVDFVVDGAVVGSDATEPYSFRLPVAELGTGSHTFAAIAVDTNFDRATSAAVVATATATAYTRDVSTTAGLQQALADLSATGGSIYVEPGTYDVAQPLEIASHIDLVGAGWERTTIRAAAQAGYALLRLDGAVGTSVRDLTLDYDGGTNAAVYLSQPSSGNLFQRLRVIGLGAAEFGIEGWQQPGSELSVQDSSLDGSTDGTTPGGATAIAGFGSSPATADDSVFRTLVRSFHTQGIEFATPRLMAVENTVSNVLGSGIWLGGADDIAYRNVVSQASAALIATGADCQGCLVRENALDGGAVGIDLEQGVGASAVSNTVRDAQLPVTLQSVQHGVVAGNDLRGAARFCIFETDSDYTAITGNDCRGSTSGVVSHTNAGDGANDAVSGNLWP